MRPALLLSLSLCALPACGPAASDGSPDAGDASPDATTAPPPDAVDPDGPGDDSVWAHSNRRLYRVDPGTLAVTEVGAIQFSDGINQLTDLAVDRLGGVVGISTRQLYRIDKTTADATLLAQLPEAYNGLSYVDDGAGGEALVAAAQDGSLYRLDETTGDATLVGGYGGGLTSGGDLVFIYGEGLLATVTSAGWTTDRLARIDLATGAATVIGDTGHAQLFGIGYWGGEVFGFSQAGAFVTIDVDTGAATVASTSAVAWWGAGVTTTAPVVD
jgi:hypothetical protein